VLLLLKSLLRPVRAANCCNTVITPRKNGFGEVASLFFSICLANALSPNEIHPDGDRKTKREQSTFPYQIRGNTARRHETRNDLRTRVVRARYKDQNTNFTSLRRDSNSASTRSSSVLPSRATNVALKRTHAPASSHGTELICFSLMSH
jgi:hypothetical protein